MIRSLLLLCLASPAQAQPAAPASAPPRAPDRSLEVHRTPIEALTERAIGRASRAVRFDWRRGAAQVGITGGLPAELNNFDALRAGAFVRLPAAGLLFELALAYVWVSGSESSESLALTPYRQPGRPDHLELDLAVNYPIAEGVVTPVTGWLPAAQLVLSAQGQFRYLIYPGAWSGLDLQDSLKAIVSGRLSPAELDNLEDERLPGMETDRARYALWAGFNTDIYFQSGIFFAQKVLVAVPLLARATRSELYFGFELDLSVGYAF